MASKNKLLTLEEVLALPEGARVWVETCDDFVHKSKVFTARRKNGQVVLFEGKGKYMLEHRHWEPSKYPEHYGKEFRVWSLPQPPTQEEMDANPWEVRE